MRITILNKNNNQWSEVDEGAVYTACFNETLDSGVVTISNLTSKLKLEPYDIMYIQEEQLSLTKIFSIDTYNEIMLCVNPRLYKYEIHVFSETKQLENVILPNLKITKVWGQTRSIYYYINQYMTEYCPYIRVGTDEANYSYKPIFKWTNALDNQYSLNRFTEIECPEMQWNTPTLREVLNDLMMVADCIPVIENGYLWFMDLTKTKRDVTNDSHINYVSRSKSSENYVSELQVPLVNVTNKNNENNIVTKTEYCVFDTPDDEVVSRSNSVRVKTKYPIYNLKSVVVMFPVSYNDNGEQHQWIVQDLMNVNNKQLVVEQKEWLTKQVSYGTNTPSDLSDFADYQNWCLYYVRGGNEILNFDGTAKFGTGTFKVIDELPIFVTKWRRNNNTVLNSSPKWYNILFKVEYETLEGCVFRASKSEYPGHDRVVIDNQTNSYVDSYAQGFLEYQKANRLGNEQLQINARYEWPLQAGERLLEIGDVYEDSIIYQCQYQFYKNHIEINAVATKNYVLREYFTGVKSKIRSWAISSGDEALTRHDLQKYYCEFSFEEHHEVVGLEDLADFNVGTYLLTPLQGYSAQPLKLSAVRTYNSYDSNYLPRQYGSNPQYYCVDLISRIVGNSLVFTFGFDDNYWAGKSYLTIENSSESNSIEPTDIKNEYDKIIIDADKLVGSPGGVPTYQNAYANSIGECDYYEIIFADGIHVGSYQYTDPVDGTVWGSGHLDGDLESQSKYFLWCIYQRPVIDTNRIYYSGNYDYRKISFTVIHKKDSQEIEKISTQFEFSTETNDICFSKEFLKRQKAINTSNNTNNSLTVLLYNKNAYNFRRPDELPDVSEYYNEESIAQIITGTTVSGNLNGFFTIRLGTAYDTYNEMETAYDELVEKYCFYLTDGNIQSENPKPIMAFRNFKLIYNQINNKYYIVIFVYLNILKSRNKNIYDENNHYLIVDEI